MFWTVHSLMSLQYCFWFVIFITEMTFVIWDGFFLVLFHVICKASLCFASMKSFTTFFTIIMFCKKNSVPLFYVLGFCRKERGEETVDRPFMVNPLMLCNRLSKAIQMIYRLFLVTAMYCQASSSQFFSITQPLSSFSVLAGWEGSLGTCSR